MDEWVKPHAEPGNRLVLVVEEVARGRDAVAGLGLVRAGLSRPEILQSLRRVENAVGVYVANDRADFRIQGHRAAGRAGEYDRKSNDEHEGADDQRALHRSISFADSRGKCKC
jgi:hypothetical protein